MKIYVIIEVYDPPYEPNPADVKVISAFQKKEDADFALDVHKRLNSSGILNRNPYHVDLDIHEIELE